MALAGMLFLALIAIYIASTGRARKVLEAMGATGADSATPVPETQGQGSPGGSEQTNADLLTNNAMLYNTRLSNPGATNTNSSPYYQTNYGYNQTNPYDFTGYSG